MKRILAATSLAGALLTVHGYEFKTESGIRYSDNDERCVLDVKWPTGVTNFATVVNFHGGGLVGGAKHFAKWPKEAENADPVAFVAANYRLLSDKKTGRKASPEACISDAAAAVAWTLENISRYGGDPAKVFVTGISGGGYLTAMVGMDAKWLAKYGHKPSELAGIAPMTGQMTKHFNVRKIGFDDADPQFCPKVDEWAPLRYAGEKELPPACFLTGGRDVEWKCRVEENELLAASLRSCGYPKTEFHETEGDHGGGVAPSTYFLRDFVMKTCDAGGVGRFADGERVAFCGDSITHGGSFIFYLQLFQDLRHPGSRVRLINCGRSGDTALGGVRRFERDILPLKADRVFMMFGMNDVGRSLWKSAEPSAKEVAQREKHLADFREGTVQLVDKLAEAHVKTVVITPSPFDQYGVLERENLPFCNEPALSSCASFVRELAAKRNLGLVEFHEPMTRLFKEQANRFHFCYDRVHPGQEGHLMMAALVLDAMHVSPFVATVRIEAKEGAAKVKAKNASVTAVRLESDEVAFTYAPKALPFPRLPECEKLDEMYPFTARLNQELLSLTGLEKGKYVLAFDGKEVGVFTDAQFAKGVNIALLDTSNQLRAQGLAEPMRRLCANRAHIRRVALVKLMLQDAGVDENDRAKTDAWLADWLERHKNSPSIRGLKGWVDGYLSGRDKVVEMDRAAEDLYETMGAVRPAVSRVTIKLEK